MMHPQSVAARVVARDTTLFDAIDAELTVSDRSSMLALQAIVASRRGSYRYLEIGSHKGGSIQPHLLDDRCEAIVSVDPRPLSQPDERGPSFSYHENSTARMLAELAKLDSEQMLKIKTFETTAPALVKNDASLQPADLCLIDAEHTDRAAIADFEAVLSLVRSDAVVVLHDAPIIYRAIAQMLEGLRQREQPFSAFPLPDSLFVIVLGDADALAQPEYRTIASDVGPAYLTALQLNSGYRDFYQLLPFRAARSLLARIGFSRLADGYQYGSRGGSRSA